jgi:predicted PurR-regulated permease PerM
MLSFSKPSQTIAISPSIAVFTVGLLSILYLLYVVRNLLMLACLAIILMVALHPFVAFLEKRARLPRTVSTVVVYLSVIGLFVATFGFILPPVLSDLYSLIVTLNNNEYVREQLQNASLSVSEITVMIERFGRSVELLWSAISTTSSGIFGLFTLVMVSAFMTIDRPHLPRILRSLIHHDHYRQLIHEFIESVESQLGGWVRGQVILMVVIGVITYVGLSLLQVPYALPLAVLAGLLEILPNLGPTLAAIPAIAVAGLMVSPFMGGVTLIFYIVVQQLENSLIVPKIMRDNADVHPLVAMFAILAGFKLASVPGALLALPAYIVLRTLFRLWRREMLLKK